MDAFPDRRHVWLRAREYDLDYLYASEDGEGVACSPMGPGRGVLHAAWAVHRLVRGNTDYVLFHNASYGRYLAQIEERDEEGDYYRAGQCTYDSPEQENVLFQARRAEDGSDDIYLRNPRLGVWFPYSDEDTPFHWVVEVIPLGVSPELPDPPQPAPAVPHFSGRRMVQAAQPQPVVFRRRINYLRADDQGNLDPQQWRVLEQFEGQSVFNLRRDLAAAMDEAGTDDLGITLCVWGGSNGRWTPLVIDLPPNEMPMNIVVLTTGSPAAFALRHPDLDLDA